MIDTVDMATMDSFVHSAVPDSVSLVVTDEHLGYGLLRRDLPHETIKHGDDNYVVGAIHTQAIEGF